MAVETYANNSSSTLNGGINNSVTSLVVHDASTFPTTGNFRILIESEILIVTGVSGTTFTVSRGAEGTTAASHADSSTVTHVLTRDGLQALIAKGIVSDQGANRSSASLAGRLFLPTDGWSIQRDNGSDWTPWGPIMPFVPLDNSLYSWVNQGSATLDTSGQAFYLAAGAGTGSDSLHIRVKSIPSTPYVVRMAFLPQLVYPANFNACGMILRNSSSGKLVSLQLASDTGQSTLQVINGIKWTNETTFSAFYTLTPVYASSSGLAVFPWQMGPCMWFQMADDGTNRTMSVSNDGVHFFQAHSVAHTDFMTPDQIGFFINQQNSTYGLGITVLSFTGG